LKKNEKFTCRRIIKQERSSAKGWFPYLGFLQSLPATVMMAEKAIVVILKSLKQKIPQQQQIKQQKTARLHRRPLCLKVAEHCFRARFC